MLRIREQIFFLRHEREEFRILGEEVTEEMRLGLTIETQKDADQTIKSVYGEFILLDYIETWADPGKTLFILGFRGNFSGGDEKPEIRVVLNKEGKLAGLWLKPWNDNLQ